MTSVEKRRSGRKSGSHRKHSDGGYSDTSSGGSFLDENDREVSSLTDRAFRSLCIGDEAVYNDSDLSLSSPCTQRDRQLAFSHSGQDKEDTEREELKRTAHENFSLRVQQYGQDWVHGGMYGAEIHREPQWEVYGDRAHGMVSATFQHSYVETTQQANTLREEQLSFFSNGATELSSQQRRSRSRVSSLIRAFNSEAQRDGPVVDERLKEWNDETPWDKSALMSIQRELSEFSTSYQQNFNSGHFPSAGQFSSQDANFYSSEVAAMAHMSHNSAPSFMRSSHSKHTMSAQVNCNSNFFIHSEFSPFRVWRDYNRFPFQHGEVSGFMHCSEYKTPMYKELSLEDQQRGPYRGNRHLRNNLAPAVPPAHTRSTSTSTMLQKASSVEKRCESELAGHYPHRKRAQSLGSNRLPSQRPSTASPTIEMSRRVRDTISSVKALQQKIKMMTEQNITTGVIPNQQQGLYSNQNLISINNTATPNVVSSNTSTTPFNISQLLTPFVPAHQEVDFQQYAASPPPVEHPPVRAESRGATPDVRMSSYKSRATSLLFNLKDNRKRVKSTYSPTKFKGMENAEKNKPLSNQEPRETVIDMPDFPDPYNQLEESSRANAGVYQYHSHGVPLNSQPASVHTGQYPEYAISDYQPAQMQVHHTGFTGFIPENYPSNQVANGQNLYEDLASFASDKQDMMDNVGTLEGNVYTLNSSYPGTPKLTADNNKSREYLISKANTEQPFNETVGRVFTKVERYEQLQDNKYDYNNAPSQDWWRQTNSQDTEKPSVKAAASPWKQEMRQENLSTKEHELCPPQKYSDKNENKGNYMIENYHKYTDQEYRNQHAFYSAKDQPAATKERSPRKQYIIPKIQEIHSSLQPVEAKTEVEQNLLSDPDNITAPIIPSQMKDRKLVEVKAEQVMLEPIKAQHTPAELAEAQQWAQVEQPKAEQERLILARQTSSEKVTTEEGKSELTKQERLKQPRTKQPEKAREQTEPDTTRIQKETDKPRNITEDIREELGKQVNTEQAEEERLKQEHIKTELPNTEQAKMRQAKTEQVSGKRISAEQVEEEQVKAGEEKKEVEQIRSEKVNVEHTATECRDAEATKTEQMKEAKAEQMKTKEVEVEKVKSDHIKVMDNRQAKDEKNEMSKIIAKGTTALTSTVIDEKLEERKAAQATLEQRKTDKMLERSAKLTAKLTSTQPVKSEPDKVEQVKTELAKAKAELAKIKEKMRGDHKEKVRNITKKGDDLEKSNKNEDYRKQDQGAQIQQMDTLYKNDRGAEDYDQLRQKYGFTNAVSTNKTKESAAENGSSTDTQNTSLNKVGTVNKDTSNDSFTTKVTAANMENKEVPHSYSEGTETLYVYSESSKEFKLSSADYCLTNADKTTIDDNATKTVNNDIAEKHDSLRETDGSQQKDLGLAKVLPVERKPKSTEPNVSLGKDLHCTPPKALSQKERAQTKQDILTSKIKAHAEKEISAIKEKGFAKRDGIISKGSMKQLPGSQTVIARQKPPSQEVYKKSENVLSSNTTPKHKMEFSGAQNNQVKHISPPSSAMTKPAAAATLLAPQNPLKYNSKEPKQAETKSPVQNQERENPWIDGLYVQNNEHLPTTDKGKEQENCGEISGKHKENLKDSTDKKKVDLAEVKGVKAASCKSVMTEKAENKEAAHEDTEPSISLVLGQKEVPVADNSLQIMGIMVTVRERKPSMSSAQENNSIHGEKKEHVNSEPNKCHPNSDFVLREAKTSQKEIKSKDRQKMVDQAKDIKSPENVQETSTSETRKKNVPENVTQNTSINAKPQRETEPLVKKDVPFSVTIPAKNTAETQFLVCEQNTTSRETKDHADKSDKERSTKREQTDDNNRLLKHNEAHTGENNQAVGNVHIDSIAIRVLPTAMERGNMKMEGKHPVTTNPSDVVSANDHKHQHTAPSSQEGKVNNEDLMPASSEKKMNDSVEDKLGVQHILSSVRKLSESLKNSTHENRANSSSKNIPAEQPLQGDYFQVQGAPETSNKQHNNSTIVVDASKDRGLPENKTDVSNESHKERKNEAFVFSVDQGKRKIEESEAKSTQEENMKRKQWEAQEKLASKQTDGSTERCNNEKMGANGTNHIRKHNTENHPNSSESQSSRNPTREHTLKEKPEAKPKPKERVSTIPEISALADYARLKVIVSDDKEADTVKELPPNKKEGFFPLIQSRHSRRPVFTADPQDLSVKEKGLPNKTEMNAKVNKEPKAPIFPITEQEHQKTGMFKLGDKKRQEKIPQDNEVNHGVLDNVTTNSNHKAREKRKKTSTVQTGQTAVGDTHSQVDKGICPPNNNLPTTTSSVANMPRNTSEKQTNLNENSVPQSTVGQMHHRTGNVTLPRKDERVEKQQDKDTGAKTEEGRTDKIKTERTSTQQEDTKVKQQAEIKTLNREVSKSEEEKREEAMKIKHMVEESRASLAEEERKASQREEERRTREREAVAAKIKERREKQREAEIRAEERRIKQTEEEMKTKQREEEEEEERNKETGEERRKKAEENSQTKLGTEESKDLLFAEEQQREAAQEDQQTKEEQKKRLTQEEQQRRVEQEEKQRTAVEERQRRAVEEQQRRAAEEEQQRRAVEEQQKRAEKEQQRRAAVDQQRRAVEERQRRAAEEEQQRRAVEEQQKRAAEEEQQRRAAAEEQQKRAVEERQRRAAEEHQMTAAQEEQRAAEEQQRKAAQEEQQRRTAKEKQRGAVEDQQRRAAAEEKHRRAAQEEQQRRAEKEQQRRAAEDQQRRSAAEEKQRRAAVEDQQRRAAQEEPHRRAAEEQQRRLVQEEKQIRSAQKEQQRRPTEEQQRTREEKQTKHIEEKIFSDDEEEKKRKQREEEKGSHNLEEERIRQDDTKAEQLYIGQGRERYCSPEKARHLEENEAALNEKKKTQEQMLAREDIQAQKKKEEFAVHREQVKAAQTEKQRSPAHMDTLQYYAITSIESERKPRDKQVCSPFPSQQRNNPSGLDSTEESASHSRPYRPHTPASPAPSLTRSNTSSPSLGTKPSMFRVKDNTTRGSSFIKSVIPRFHKNFGEDFRVGSPMDKRSDRGEDEQEIMRCNAGTPVYPNAGLSQFGSINEYSSPSSSQDYIVPIPHHRPYSRRSIAMDEEDTRSIVSNMSEGVESFATSVADLADVRGLYDYDRPESACSFSSDVSRSLGKPPAVPPKSEKALRRAKRLTTRRIKKELSKAAVDGSVKAEKEVSSIPSSSSTEVRSTNRHAVASPHFSSPVSLAHAPALGSSLPSSQTEHSSPHHTFRASPHSTGPVSIPVASPHATAPISLPSVSPHATGPASQLAPPKVVAHVSSSPTLHHANHPAPVTQYQVESSYPQSYPLTQRKVLQDPGSGQYFVVDLPVQVKTKTFFDPETGKYVQLNVRESGQSISQQPHHQHPQLQSKVQIKPQEQPLSQTCPDEKPYVLYQGYYDYPKGYQSTPINNVHPHRSSDPVTLYQQDQQPVGESHIYGYPAPETQQNSGGHRYSPEKTPYMDTVKDMDKKYNRVYNTYGSQEPFPESDTNSQLAGSSVCENDTSAHSRYQPRDIITMSELEDFMEVSDW